MFFFGRISFFSHAATENSNSISRRNKTLNRYQLDLSNFYSVI